MEHRSHSKRELTEKGGPHRRLSRGGPGRDGPAGRAGAFERPGLCRKLCPELIQRKRYGLRRVRQELARKGIPRTWRKKCWPPYGAEDSAGENIRLVLSKRYALWREDEKVRRRAVAALQRLGYSLSRCARLWAGWIRNKGKPGGSPASL